MSKRVRIQASRVTFGGRALAVVDVAGILSSIVGFIAAIGFSIVAIGTGGRSDHIGGLVGVFCAIAVPVAVMLLRARMVRPTPGVLMATDTDLVVERGSKTHTYPLASIQSGAVVPGPFEHEIDLQLSGGKAIRARVAPDADADGFLDAAGLGASQRRITRVLPRRGIIRSVPWIVAAIAVFGTHAVGSMFTRFVATTGMAPGVMAAIVGLITLVVSRHALSRTKVTVGADGITIGHAFREHFVAYRDLRAVGFADDTIALHRNDRISEHIRSTYVGRDAVEALAHRIEIAKALSEGASASSAQLALLERNGRALPQWQEELRMLADRPVGYRGVPLSRSDLVRVLEDPQARSEHRVGAALALSASSDPTAKERVRVAAASSANERVRVVLERIGNGEVEEADVSRATEQSVAAASHTG